MVLIHRDSDPIVAGVGIVFGVLAAMLLGGSDVCAAQASRTVSSVTVTRTAVGLSGLVVALLLFVVPSTWSVRDSVFGAASGVTMSLGLLMLYRGYSIAPVGVVAPTSSVLSAAIPVAVELVRGRVPSALVGVGIVFGLCGIGLATYQPRGTATANASTADSRAGLLLGLGSGLCFGIGFALLANTSNAAGLVPVLLQRIVGFSGLLLLGLLRRRVVPVFASHGPERRFSMLTGLFAGIGMSLLKLGFRRGPIGSVAVAVSQFATFAVIFAVVFQREPLRKTAGIGIACAAVGVALMSLG
jgi:drug/metabolite transporter (DMT)-like permease